MKVFIDNACPKYQRIEPDVFTPLVEKVLWVNHSKFAFPEYSGAKHLHHCHQMDIILDGEFRLAIEDDQMEIGHAGDAWVVPPLTWHRKQCLKPYYLCSFKFYLAPRYWPHFGTTFHRFHISQETRQYITFCAKNWKHNSVWASQQISDVLSLCLGEFVEQSPQMSVEEDTLDEFRHTLWPLLETFLKNPSMHWTVERMAKEKGLTADYFSRCFRRILGQTPRRYILEATMRAAASSLLENPSQPIKQIAESAGYANVYSFTRAFTQVFKISPAAYRQQAMPGI